MSKTLKGSFINKLDILMTTNFSSQLCTFRKNHNAQYSFLKFERHLDKGDKIKVILMDLLKAFDTISRNLLLAKLVACGF